MTVRLIDNLRGPAVICAATATTCLLLVAAVAFAIVVPRAVASEAEVSVGSPSGRTPQNQVNEPAVAIDAHAPNVLAAGANDTVDFAPCPQSLAAEEGTCAVRFAGGVGLSGVYFSFDGGRNWTQPTYTGLTGHDCASGDACTPHVGPIHTLPWYSKADLFTWGDPALASAPCRGTGSSRGRTARGSTTPRW
jgi:hypothetical protein